MIKSYQEIKNTVENMEKKKIISVAMADDLSVLKAIKTVEEHNIAEGLLVGDFDKIKACAGEIGFEVNDDKIIPGTEQEDIAAKSVDLITSGKADVLMKGHISTPILMRAVLNKENGLRNGEHLSHVAVCEIALYPKLLLFSDGGINILPDLKTKKSILENMLQVANKLEISQPKVCALCPIEKVSPKIIETVDAAELQKAAENGELGDILLEGPMAMDVALSKKAAQRKGLTSNIAGDTDCVLAPNLCTGNATIKSLIYLADAKVGGVVVGAKVPIILLSRSDSSVEKINSIALSILVS